MAIEIVNGFEGLFIGTVMEINTTTREIAVYLPKLMPAIPYGGISITSRTNLGNLKTNINYNSNITTSTSFWVKAENSDEPMPKIGSKVQVFFLENNPRFGFWKKFKPDEKAYSVIDSEKYPKIASLKINNITTDIYQDDEIILDLGDEFECTKVIEGKKTTIKLVRKTQEEKNDEALDIVKEIQKKLIVPKPKKADILVIKDNENITDIRISVQSNLATEFEVRLGTAAVIINGVNEEISIIDLFRKFFDNPNNLSESIKNYKNFELNIYSRTSLPFLYNSDDYLAVRLTIE